MTKKEKGSLSDLDLIENLKAQEEPEKKPKKHKKASFFGKFFLYLGIIIVIGGISLSYKVILSADSIITSSQKLSVFKQLKYIVTTPERPVLGEEEGRINFLLLGMGGQGHSGGLLADTIMVASIDPVNKQVGFLSIPRDLYVPIPGHGSRKINNAYALGEVSQEEAGGAALMTEVIENITGLKIHYYLAADFAGFRKIIDDLGSIETEVERSFTDYRYPDYNFGYQVVSFTEGPNQFNGEQALQYARSRHGNNGEGSDFARSRRQQKIIVAVKEKALSVYTLINPALILSVLEDLGDHVRTNTEPWEMIRVYRIVKNIEENSITNKVLDNSPDGVLHTISSPDGAYLLAPIKGNNDFSDIQKIAQNIFETSPLLVERASIEIQNGTATPGLAKKAQAELESYRLNIASISNAKNSDYEKTIIYDLSGVEKPETVSFLVKMLNASLVPAEPAYLYTADSPDLSYDSLLGSQDIELPYPSQDVDILIVLGEEYNQEKNSPDKTSRDGEDVSAN